MVPPCTERVRRSDHTNIPSIDKTFHDGKKIPVTLEQGGPVDWLEEGMRDGYPEAILIGDSGGKNLVHEL
jgi:hypothetical protein